MKKFLPGLVLIFVLAVASIARAQSFTDMEIKAAYIMKLSKFVTWGGQHLNHINFCYVDSGQDNDPSVGSAFAKLVRAKNMGGEWGVKALHGSLEGLSHCNMLFIPDTEESSVSSILAKAHSYDILTMSDAHRFIYKEGMLGFVFDDDNHVKMEANLKNIRKTGVMVSATVLELMQQVVKD